MWCGNRRNSSGDSGIAIRGVVGCVDNKEEGMRVIEGWGKIFQENKHTFDYTVFVFATEGLARAKQLRGEKEEGLMAIQPVRLEVPDAEGK